MFTTSIKRLIYPLYILPKVSLLKRKKINKLFSLYKEKAIAGEPVPYSLTGLRVFSNMEEDGIILWLVASLQIEKGIFLDIGSNDCINSNCANLVFNLGWRGTFIDGSKKLLRIGERNYEWFGKTKNQQLRFIASFLTADNANEVIDKAKISTDIDFMSIDVDGDDYAIWQALTAIQPKIVVVENKIEYGMNDIIIPVSPSSPPETWGASPLSMTKLAKKKGYTLVAANKKGFNTFYLRNDLINKVIPPIKVKDIILFPTSGETSDPL